MEYLRSRLPLASYPFCFSFLIVLPLALLLTLLIAEYGFWSQEVCQLFTAFRGTYPFITQGMRFISAYADDILYTIYLGLMVYAIARGDKRYRHFFVRLLIGLVFILVTVEITKFVLGMPRPYISLPRDPFNTHSDFNSFPSAHTAQVVALSLPLVFYYRKHWLTLLIAVLIAVVGLSRLWLGRHYPIDVAGGVLAGSMIVLLMFRSQTYTKTSIKSRIS